MFIRYRKNLISSIIITLLLVYFLTKSSDSKIILIPFLICSVSMAGKSLAQIFQKKKLELAFGKLFVLGFLLFYIGFLVLSGYIVIRDKNYGLLAFYIPFWLVGIYLIKNRLLNRKGKQNGEQVLSFAMIVSALLVAVAFFAGIFLFVLGVKAANVAMLFGGVFFSFVSFAFVLFALMVQGCFDKIKVDVLGVYAGVVLVVIGTGFLLLQYTGSNSLMETVKSFGLWMIIPIMMVVAGVIQIVKCFRNKK